MSSWTPSQDPSRSASSLADVGIGTHGGQTTEIYNSLVADRSTSLRSLLLEPGNNLRLFWTAMLWAAQVELTMAGCITEPDLTIEPSQVLGEDKTAPVPPEITLQPQPTERGRLSTAAARKISEYKTKAMTHTVRMALTRTPLAVSAEDVATIPIDQGNPIPIQLVPRYRRLKGVSTYWERACDDVDTENGGDAVQMMLLSQSLNRYYRGYSVVEPPNFLRRSIYSHAATSVLALDHYPSRDRRRRGNAFDALIGHAALKHSNDYRLSENFESALVRTQIELHQRLGLLPETHRNADRINHMRDLQLIRQYRKSGMRTRMRYRNSSTIVGAYSREMDR